jgi:hypothetical protein
MNYYDHPYTSNSDLSKLFLQLKNRDYQQEFNNAYRIGTLVDALITTPAQVDFENRTVIGTKYGYTLDELGHGQKCRDAFHKDRDCADLLKICTGQMEIYKSDHPIEYNGIRFTRHMKCKPDLYSLAAGMGPDIKTTTATSQAQFEAAAKYFRYPRQRAVYMDLTGFKKDILIGISKKNFQIFKIHIRWGDAFHMEGWHDYRELAYKHWGLGL